MSLAFYFEEHYFYGTYINEMDCSYKTPVEAEFMLHASVEDYTLHLAGRKGLTDQIPSKEIGMEYAMDDSLYRIQKEQKSWQWVLGFFQEHSYDLEDLINYNEKKLEDAVRALVFLEKEHRYGEKDAHISYSGKDGRYILLDYDPGTELKEEVLQQAVKEAIHELEKELVLEDTGCYLHQAKEQKDRMQKLQQGAEEANRYLEAEILYDWNGSRVEIDRDLIRGWLEIRDTSVVLKEERVMEFLRQQAKKYDTYGDNINFQSSDGRQIRLNTPAYGWETDLEEELAVLLPELKAGAQAERKPVHQMTEPSRWQVELGDSFVEIDLTSQRLYLYVKGEQVLESDFVSGNTSRGWTTPAGVFGLTYKTRDAVLRGEGYATPVSYWMPFNGNIGMHDAVWRNSFGGDIYQTNGSHGCINLPLEKAKIIYEYVYTGFPIVCYY